MENITANCAVPRSKQGRRRRSTELDPPSHLDSSTNTTNNNQEPQTNDLVMMKRQKKTLKKRASCSSTSTVSSEEIDIDIDIDIDISPPLHCDSEKEERAGRRGDASYGGSQVGVINAGPRESLYLEDLPNEIIVHIVSKLPTAQKLGFVSALPNCSRLKTVIQGTPMIWRNLDLSAFFWEHSDRIKKAFAMIKNISPFARQITCECSFHANEILLHIAMLARDCRVLNLANNDQLRMESLVVAGQSMKNIRELDLSRCRGLDSMQFGDLFDSFPKLTHLNLSGTLIRNARLHRIRQLTDLKSLSLSRCIFLDSEALREILRIIGGSLEYLNLSQNDDVEQSVVEAIMEHCRNLKVLDVTNCYHLIGDDITRLRGHFTKREEVPERGNNLFVSYRPSSSWSFSPSSSTSSSSQFDAFVQNSQRHRGIEGRAEKEKNGRKVAEDGEEDTEEGEDNEEVHDGWKCQLEIHQNCFLQDNSPESILNLVRRLSGTHQPISGLSEPANDQ
eukprot:Nk52_evm24s224 gene=Nk52_evmTU24s224